MRWSRGCNMSIEKCLRTWNSETNLDDNVSSPNVGSQRKTTAVLGDKKLVFSLDMSASRVRNQKNKKHRFINDRTVNTYCFRRKGNETMTKEEPREHATGRRATTVRKPHNGCTRSGFEGRVEKRQKGKETKWEKTIHLTNLLNKKINLNRH